MANKDEETTAQAAAKATMLDLMNRLAVVDSGVPAFKDARDGLMAAISVQRQVAISLASQRALHEVTHDAVLLHEARYDTADHYFEPEYPGSPARKPANETQRKALRTIDLAADPTYQALIRSERRALDDVRKGEAEHIYATGVVSLAKRRLEMVVAVLHQQDALPPMPTDRDATGRLLPPRRA